MATTVCPSWRRANGWQSDFAEHQRAVGAAKTKRIFHGDIDSHIACRIRTVVKIALGILIENVDGRRRQLLVYRQHGEYRLQSAGAAQQVAGHRYGEIDADLLGM